MPLPRASRRAIPGTLLLVATLSAPSALGQPPPPAAAESFATFDRELRDALRRGDVVALALLVRFPLRLNHADGGVTTLENPRALQSEFGSAFPAAVRRAVLDSTSDDLIWRGGDVGYKGGALWVEEGEQGAGRFRVAAVNLPPAADDCGQGCEPELLFVCNAPHRRVVIDRRGSGPPRYRAWDRPRSLSAVADLELGAGEERSLGTTPCTHRSWSFANTGASYTVSELGCTDGSEPAGAIGTLEVAVGGEARAQWWCF